MNLSLDIVSLIENNPITSLKANSQSKLLIKIKEEFTDSQQHLFVGSFYCYLNHHPTNDYVVELDNVWKWLGFTRIDNVKRILINNFKENIDYKVEKTGSGVFLQTEENLGGRPKEKILMNIKTFKKLCLKSRTDKADDIHEYYIKLEELIQETMKEQSEEYELELKEKQKQIEQKDQLIENMVTQVDPPKYLYIAYNPAIPNLSKLGITKNILERKDAHNTSNPDLIYKKTYETKYAADFEYYMKNLLKPFKYTKPEWFHCSIKQLEDIADYFYELFNTYEGHKSINGLHRFVSIAQHTRIKHYERKYDTEFSEEIYKKYVDECLIKEPQFKINVTMLINDFEKWLKGKSFEKSIRNTNNQVPTSVKDGIVHYISEITGVPKSNGISYTNPVYNVFFSNCNGFLGLKLKSLETTTMVEKEVYDQFVKANIEITNDSRDKVTRLELVNLLVDWCSKNKITLNNDIYSNKNNFTQTFLNEFSKQIETYNVDYNVMGTVGKQKKVACFSKLKITNGINIKDVYQKFITDTFTITGEYKNKLSKSACIDKFIDWSKANEDYNTIVNETLRYNRKFLSDFEKYFVYENLVLHERINIGNGSTKGYTGLIAK